MLLYMQECINKTAIKTVWFEFLISVFTALKQNITNKYTMIYDQFSHGYKARAPMLSQLVHPVQPHSDVLVVGV